MRGAPGVSAMVDVDECGCVVCVCGDQQETGATVVGRRGTLMERAKLGVGQRSAAVLRVLRTEVRGE